MTQFFQIVISTYVGPDDSLITFFFCGVPGHYDSRVRNNSFQPCPHSSLTPEFSFIKNTKLSRTPPLPPLSSLISAIDHRHPDVALDLLHCSPLPLAAAACCCRHPHHPHHQHHQTPPPSTACSHLPPSAVGESAVGENFQGRWRRLNVFN